MYSMLSLKGICSILTIQKGQTVSKQNKVFSLLNLNTYKSLTTLNRIRWILPAWLFELTSYEVYKAQQIKFKNAASKGVKFKICLPYITSWSFSFLIAKLLFYRFSSIDFHLPTFKPVASLKLSCFAMPSYFAEILILILHAI